jgi:exodeoxyribonuclease VII large subunit
MPDSKAGRSNAAVVGRDIYSVSRLNRDVRTLLEGSFPLLWVEGELSNLSRPASGHWYFSLKDDQAQVRCAMFRNRNASLRFTPANGMQVLVRARISLYEARGDFQLIVEHIEEAGFGALQRAFEALKQRLAKEGLFDAQRKKSLPPFPKCVGVITSPSGAAIRDVLTTLRRRCPSLPVIIYPVPVQGADAGTQIARAVELAERRGECDVLLLVRGGGSLEDLWAFNEEVVARAVYASTIPVVSGIGHEIDFTIADFVADQRAPTPTAAAELVSPAHADLLRAFADFRRRAVYLMNSQLSARQQRLTGAEKRLRHPGRTLQNIAQRLDELELRRIQAQNTLLRHAGARLATAHARLQRHTPITLLRQHEARRRELGHRLHTAWSHRQERDRQRLAGAARQLETVSPLSTLDRGYAIVRRLSDGAVVRAAGEVDVGTRVVARLARGEIECLVEAKRDD